MIWSYRWAGPWLALMLAAGASAESGEAAPGAARPEETRAIERELEAIREQNQRLEEAVRRLEAEVHGSAEAVEPPTPPPTSSQGSPLWSRGVGTANLQLLDLSVDVIAAAGGSTARDVTIELLQGGDHDPRQRGFTLQQVELSLQGAVDPYVTGEVHLIYFLDTEGESRFEIEEAFLQSIALPFGLEDWGLQVEVGTFFTEFGRLNPRHPHAWDWQDQPFVMSRFFGEDGLRGPGARLGWLLPVPWLAELHVGAQNADGETQVSFLANDEVFDDRPIGGRPFANRRVRSATDLTTLLRLANGFDLSDTVTAQLGGSALFGPNATGSSGRTRILGIDGLIKWVPLDARRGWPFVKLEGEALHRRYEASDFNGCFVESPGCTTVFVPERTLRDHGLYAQLLYGFVHRWAAGLRYEHGDGSGANVAFDANTATVSDSPRSQDPFRSRRHRISQLLVFYPSEYARLRLQYNYDRIRFSRDHDVHSVWFGVEFLIGAHPAHTL